MASLVFTLILLITAPDGTVATRAQKVVDLKTCLATALYILETNPPPEGYRVEVACLVAPDGKT